MAQILNINKGDSLTIAIQIVGILPADLQEVELNINGLAFFKTRNNLVQSISDPTFWSAKITSNKTFQWSGLLQTYVSVKTEIIGVKKTTNVLTISVNSNTSGYNTINTGDVTGAVIVCDFTTSTISSSVFIADYLKGEQGIAGIQGVPGQGVPVGGTTGQVLSKIDGTNYNTQWISNTSNQQTLFIQQTQPSANYNYIWYELDVTGNIVTMWINTI